MNFTRGDFPEGFLFGAATSAYQIEGHGLGGAGETHWDSFAATHGNVVDFADGRVACDHYRRYGEDLDLAAALGLDAYRFSTSWARVLPEGRGAPNEAGLDFYDRLVDAVAARGLKAFPTLYHWELPSALADLGGWRNPDIAHWFADFAQIVMRRIGDRVHAVAPINEPWCVAWLSHFHGAHAPGMRDIRAAARAMHHVLLAHGAAVAAMRAQGVGNIGMVVNMEWAAPGDDSAAARRATEIYDAIYNRWFLDAARHRRYPEAALSGLAPWLPRGWEGDFDRIAQPLDWIGVNYYTRKLIVDDGTGRFPFYADTPGPLPKTGVGWEIYPDGLHQFLMRVEAEYADGLPIYVTENGLALDDPLTGGAVSDRARIDYLDAHLAAVRRAIADGAGVAGYFQWSLLDNYEWALGYAPRFGLVHVDYATQARTPKASYHALAAALARA